MSNQSYASLCTFYKSNPNELWPKIQTLLASKGIYLVSPEIAIYLSQQLVCEEFEERWKSNRSVEVTPRTIEWKEQPTSVAYNSEITLYLY